MGSQLTSLSPCHPPIHPSTQPSSHPPTHLSSRPPPCPPSPLSPSIPTLPSPYSHSQESPVGWGGMEVRPKPWSPPAPPHTPSHTLQLPPPAPHATMMPSPRFTPHSWGGDTPQRALQPPPLLPPPLWGARGSPTAPLPAEQDSLGGAAYSPHLKHCCLQAGAGSCRCGGGSGWCHGKSQSRPSALFVPKLAVFPLSPGAPPGLSTAPSSITPPLHPSPEDWSCGLGWGEHPLTPWDSTGHG